MKNVKEIFYSFLIMIVFNSCSEEKKKSFNDSVSDEKFSDSLNVGEKGITKVEIQNFRHGNNGNNFVKINFYTLKKIWVESKDGYFHYWKKTTNFYFDKDGITGIDVEILDFNNDGYKDFTYQSGIAGRGGNLIRKLFVYNPGSKRFIYIKNSDNYPNLSYNSKLRCISSFILTGSVTTSFLKIKGDSLDEFAKINVSDKIVVEEKDSSGKFRIIQEEKIDAEEDIYRAFTNYKPLEN